MHFRNKTRHQRPHKAHRRTTESEFYGLVNLLPSQSEADNQRVATFIWTGNAKELGARRRTELHPCDQYFLRELRL